MSHLGSKWGDRTNCPVSKLFGRSWTGAMCFSPAFRFFPEEWSHERSFPSAEERSTRFRRDLGSIAVLIRQGPIGPEIRRRQRKDNLPARPEVGHAPARSGSSSEQRRRSLRASRGSWAVTTSAT